MRAALVLIALVILTCCTQTAPSEPQESDSEAQSKAATRADADAKTKREPKQEAEPRVGAKPHIKISVSLSGSVTVDGDVLLDVESLGPESPSAMAKFESQFDQLVKELRQRLAKLKSVGGTVWFHQEVGKEEPSSMGMILGKVIADTGLPIRTAWKPDFSDLLEETQPRPSQK